ncbi:MAG: DUF393 domain-containing protein [Chlamydiota bacterium]
MTDHLILFDDTCPFCCHSVAQVYAWDREKLFRFAPLAGATARLVLKERWDELKAENTLVLMESGGRLWIRGRAVCRIFWILGGWKKSVGILAFFPCGIDAIYSFVAKRRHRLRHSNLRELPKDKSRFLD